LDDLTSPYTMRAPLRLATAALAVGLSVNAAPALANAQGTDATIEGRVRDARGVLVADALVRAINGATGFTVATRTSSAGAFRLGQLPLGGPYRVTAQRPGFAIAEQSGITLTLGARRSVDLILTAQPATLDAVTINAQATDATRTRDGGSTRFGAATIAALPAINRNFTDLASLAPLTGADLSIGGARATSTDLRIDGLQARNMLRGGELGRGPYTLSLEAIREFEVITNVYDVSQGRQGGGAISAVTKAGTNTREAAVFGYLRNESLSAASDFQGRGRSARPSTIWQFGASAGGPIVRDQLHYFVALDRQDASVPLAIADLRSPADEINAQLSRDSLARFVSILQNKYGLGTAPQVGVFQRRSQATTLFARLDWALSDRHLLTVRNNLTTSDSPDDGVGDQIIALHESRSGSRSFDNQLLVSLRSQLGATMQNELKLGVSVSDRTLTPNTTIPRGFVRVKSSLPDGTIGDITLQFGGNRLAPEASGERQFQVANTLTWQAGPTVVSAGVDNSLTWLTTYVPTDQGGLFQFDSLRALDNLTSSRYTRQVPLGAATFARQWVLDAGAFAQVEWRVTPRLRAQAGLRWDVTSYHTPAAPNPALTSAFGLRTNEAPTDWGKLQPRAQLTWDVGGDGRDIVQLGAGAFGAQPHYYLHANDLFFNGTQLGDLTLQGAQVPTPDFGGFRAGTTPTPGVPAATTAPAYVNLISATFVSPLTWKGSAQYTRRITDRLRVGAMLLATETCDNNPYADRNLGAPAFTIDNEGNRPVFVPAATISAAGRTTARFAFVNPAFTHVLELVPTGRASSRAVVLEGALALPRAASVRASYTWSRAEDNSTFNCCIARTSSLFTPVTGDPRDLTGSWGPSDYSAPHKVVVETTLPTVLGIVASARYVGNSGRAFSLVVNGDINGDDYSGNDLAFIPDPNDPATPAPVAAAMRRLLANPNSVARDYLAAHLGQMATRNGARAPWSDRVDVRLSRAFTTLGGQGVTLFVDVFNFANLLNPDWGGQMPLPQGISASNPISQQLALLNVVGFNQLTKRYSYTVNENVGVLATKGDPYQIQLGLRTSF
jgi:hypothetical protein